MCEFFFYHPIFCYGAKYIKQLYSTSFPLCILDLIVQPSNLTLSIQIILSFKKPKAFSLKREISSEIVIQDRSWHVTDSNEGTRF